MPRKAVLSGKLSGWKPARSDAEVFKLLGKYRRVDDPDEVPEAVPAGPASQAHAQSLAAAIEAAGLSPDERVLVSLISEGRTLAEIGATMQLSPSAVKRLRRQVTHKLAPVYAKVIPTPRA